MKKEHYDIFLKERNAHLAAHKNIPTHPGNSPASMAAAKANSLGKRYIYPNELNTEELDRIRSCFVTFEYFCATYGTTTAYNSICDACCLPARLHHRAAMCALTQENILVSNAPLAKYENRCPVCFLEMKQHNEKSSAASLFSLPSDFNANFQDKLSLQPPWSGKFEFYPNGRPPRREPRPGTAGSSFPLPVNDNTSTAVGQYTPSTGRLYLTLDQNSFPSSNDPKLPDLKNFSRFGESEELKDPYQWLTVLEDRLQLFNVPTSKWTAMMKACIDPKDYSRQAWVQENIINKNLTWNNTPDGKDGAKTAFVKQYAPPGMIERKYQELNSLKQGPTNLFLNSLIVIVNLSIVFILIWVNIH